MSNKLTRRQTVDQAIRSLAEMETLDRFIEDVFVAKRHPNSRSARAVLTEEGEVAFYSTDEASLTAIARALSAGANYRGRRIRKPTEDEVAAWLMDQNVPQLPGR